MQGDNTWEPEDNLQNAGKKLQEYLQSIPKNLDNFLTELEPRKRVMSQTSFGHISTNSLTIHTVSKPA